MFAGEAYNVEMGITNELFPNERGYPPTPLPAGCLINPTPEDTTNFDVTSTVAGPSDIVAFSNFMRFLDQPAPSCTGTSCSQSIQNGRNLFINVAKCSVCHTPSMTTGTSYVAALSNIQANLFSDLLMHHMGSGWRTEYLKEAQARINSARLRFGDWVSDYSSCTMGELPI